MPIHNLFIVNPHLILLCTIVFLIALTLNYMSIKLWGRNKNNVTETYKNKNSNIQKIHEGSIPRLGGINIFLVFLCCIFLFNFFNLDTSLIVKITLCSLPFIIITLIEDLYQNISPILRLVFLLLCSFMFLYFFLEKLPNIEIFYIDKFINIPIYSAIFFTIGLTAFMNGVNFLDGTNGLAGFTIVSCLLSLLFVAIIFNDFHNASIIIIFFVLIFAFIFFNYPNGKIFLGDVGAYFLGWFTGIMTITIMAKNPNIPNWCALIILSYPLVEVIFSFLRKIIVKKNPFYPDNKHLHLKLYFFLKDKHKIRPISAANSLVTPFLAVQWISPIILIPWIYNSNFLILIAIIFQIIIYLIFYFSIKVE